MSKFKRQSGFTLLEQISAISIFAVTSATAAQYMDQWVDTSEQQVLQYSQVAAESAMAIHQQWNQAKGISESAEWSNVIDIKGIETIATSETLTLTSPSGKHCNQLNLQSGKVTSQKSC